MTPRHDRGDQRSVRKDLPLGLPPATGPHPLAVTMGDNKITDIHVGVGLDLLISVGLVEEIQGPGAEPCYGLTERGRTVSDTELEKIIDDGLDLEKEAREDVCRYLIHYHATGPRSEAEVIAALRARPRRRYRPDTVRAAIGRLAEVGAIRRGPLRDTWAIAPRYAPRWPTPSP